jgi:hypothetical protein
MSRRNTPENSFSAVRSCPRPCARTNPWFHGQTLPVPGHGGGYNGFIIICGDIWQTVVDVCAFQQTPSAATKLHGQPCMHRTDLTTAGISAQLVIHLFGAK